MQSRWSDQDARAMPEMDGLLYASRLVGADPNLVLWGGGNTSAKVEETDYRGRRVMVLRVKGSGSDLKSMRVQDFPGVRLEDALALRERPAMTDEEMVAYLAQTLMEPASPRPSIETLLHAFLPARVVIHTHADAIMALTNTTRGPALVREALGDGPGGALWIPYQRPGFALSRQIADAFDAQPDAGCAVMEKHGLITWADTAREAYERTIEACTRAEHFVAAREDRRPCAEPALDSEARRRVYAAIAPLLRGLAIRTTGDGDLLPADEARQLPPNSRVVLRFDDSEDILHFASDPRASQTSQVGPATPDHLINTKRVPLYLPLQLPLPLGEGRGEGSSRSGEGSVAPDADALARAIESALEPAWRAWVADYRRYLESGSPNTPAPGPGQADPRPRVVLIPGLGMVTLGRDARAARISADIYHHAAATIRDAETLDRYTSLDVRDCYDVEYWPLELYKLTLAPPEKALARRVALVTGGASGIGKAIAQRLAADGAHVAIVDLNGDGACAAAEELVRANGDGRAIGIQADVSDEGAVRAAFQETVLAYGGVDVVVSNAGLSRSHPIEDTPLEEWEQLMGVLGRGYFLVAREAFRLWKRQGAGGNLVFISSKNALVGGKDNVPYSAAKAAELHMARCLAEEGGAHAIRVNTVCPDAVLQGSGIWSSDWREQRARTYGIRPDELEEHYRKRTTLKVNVLPEDVAEAVAFFASDRSAKTTGGVLTVDGGLPAAYVR